MVVPFAPFVAPRILSRSIHSRFLRCGARRQAVVRDAVMWKIGEKIVYRPGIGGVVGGGGLLATTGANLTWWIVFGVVSLVLGVVLVRSARRRAQETSN